MSLLRGLPPPDSTQRAVFYRITMQEFIKNWKNYFLSGLSLNFIRCTVPYPHIFTEIH